MTGPGGSWTPASAPVWRPRIFDDATGRAAVTAQLVAALPGRPAGEVLDLAVYTHGDGALTDLDVRFPGGLVRFTRFADLPDQRLVALAHDDPTPYGRRSWTNCDDTDLGRLAADTTGWIRRWWGSGSGPGRSPPWTRP